MPTSAEETVNRLQGRPRSPLAEQLVEFANEAFVFADRSRTSAHGKTDPNASRFPALPPSYFADIKPLPLTDLHLKNTRVVPGREQLILTLPKGAVCLEIGSGPGDFTETIFTQLKPSRLHLCGRDFNSFDTTPFGDAIEDGLMELHEGEIGEVLDSQRDSHFDLITIHADHSYVATARALEQAGPKIKDDGVLVCSNYTTYAPMEGTKCGVVRAVNEFCHAAGFEILCLALHPLGYNDVVLRRRPAAAQPGQSSAASLDVPDVNTFFPDVWDYLIEKYQVCSVLDVGAGAGWSTNWFASRGIYALGVERSREALSKSQCRGNIVEHDYTTGPFVPSMLLDLAWSAAFVEEVPEEFIPNFMASFRACQFVCLSHSEESARSRHKVNCQPEEYWIRKMSDFGFDHDAAETAALRSTDKHKEPRSRRTLSFFKKRNEN